MGHEITVLIITNKNANFRVYTVYCYSILHVHVLFLKCNPVLTCNGVLLIKHNILSY